MKFFPPMRKKPKRVLRPDLSFTFNDEKIDNAGEDADPLIYLEDNQLIGCLAVFDGMGGAGGNQVLIGNDKHTEAYLASRLARKCLLKYLQSHRIIIDEEAFYQNFEKELKNQFISQAKSIPNTRIKSTLIKKLPTTFSSIFFDLDGEELIVVSVWAGDSRAYCLDSNGLRVLSKDHTGSKTMASMNEYEKDSPMDNCVSGDVEFALDIHPFKLNKPSILLTCTDGCFGYFKSTMEFEKLILESIFNAKSLEECKLLIQKKISEVTGDDASMAFVALGFESFSEIKNMIENRLLAIETLLKNSDMAYLDLQTRNEELLAAQKKAKEFKEHYYSELETAWDKYKSGYFTHLNDVKDGENGD